MVSSGTVRSCGWSATVTPPRDALAVLIDVHAVAMGIGGTAGSTAAGTRVATGAACS